jgi:hypothetical protein
MDMLTCTGAEDHYTQIVSQGKDKGVDLWDSSSPGYGKNGKAIA